MQKTFEPSMSRYILDKHHLPCAKTFPKKNTNGTIEEEKSKKTIFFLLHIFYECKTFLFYHRILCLWGEHSQENIVLILSAVQYGKIQAMILISKDTKLRAKVYITIYKEKDEKEHKLFLRLSKIILKIRKAHSGNISIS